MTWEEHQAWEQAWWGTCLNTFSEETKQITYAHRMGLKNTPQGETWPLYDMQGKSVLDLGGGPVSMLLKTINVSRPTVVDPCKYPWWIGSRYGTANIEQIVTPAEDYVAKQPFDECWIYNVLQHVKDPQQIIINAKASARLIRLYEWLNIPPCNGHPHELKADQLNYWLNGTGLIEQMNENGCHGTAYYGVFT